jgi:hypothetical protein
MSPDTTFHGIAAVIDASVAGTFFYRFLKTNQVYYLLLAFAWTTGIAYHGMETCCSVNVTMPVSTEWAEYFLNYGDSLLGIAAAVVLLRNGSLNETIGLGFLIVLSLQVMNIFKENSLTEGTKIIIVALAFVEGVILVYAAATRLKYDGLKLQASMLLAGALWAGLQVPWASPLLRDMHQTAWFSPTLLGASTAFGILLAFAPTRR